MDSLEKETFLAFAGIVSPAYGYSFGSDSVETYLPNSVHQGCKLGHGDGGTETC